ncbi:THO complex subunit 2-like isoform X2 [Gigantopelta aegis]|uniref:THO complex subunit 2-like isoform X2 n=1 Tax=Gigantopelta aegis TaxID=1735272 RepID=UPI001B88B47B|nr:THO complex subunit 2-like isoform X2 [Gigantopelta aegis]
MASSCLTPDACKSWEKSGKSDFVKQCRKLADGNGLWDPGSQTVKHAVYDLCWCVLKGQLKQDLALGALADINDHLKDFHSLLADILGIIDVETSTTDDKMLREKFITLVGASTGIISEAILKERLDQESLEAAGLIPSKLQFQAKFVKTKTRLYYKQQKFNLLREESEGYSKLATELNQEIAYNKLTYPQVLENIKSLIGCFDLDPNRVLDIILESFECHLEHESFYIPLLRAYVLDKQTLCHVLGFRFHFYEPSQGSEIPSSLYKIAALLLKHKLVSLDDLYPHLLPNDADIVSYHNKEVSDAKVYARKLNVVVLSDKKDEDKDKEDTMKIDLRANNQKIGLCEALLEIGSWENAKAILDRMPEFFAVSYNPIAKALCTFIHAAIEPLYHQNCGLSSYLRRRRSKYPRDKSGIETVKTFQQLYQKVFPMLMYLGPHASIDPVLLVKFMRMGRAFMNKRHDGGIAPEDDVAYYGFLNVLDDVLLPCQSLLRCNCCIAEELWNFLKHFPYELRYRMYGHWKNDAYGQHPVLIRRRADCLDRAKYIMKRLSTETIKPSGRQIGKLTHSNPGVVFEYILTQIQRYDNFIGPVVDSLKFLGPMSYDMLTYCIIEAVASPERERLKHDDTNISLWLQSLANFAGSICKKYQVELGGLLQYITNQLKAGKSYDLLLLREIVQKMAGIEISEEITNDQLDAMNGGELLRQEGGYFAQVRNTKKSSTRLKDTVLEHDLAVSLCLLMAQQRDSVIFQEDAERHLKLVGKLYDQCQDTLVQFGTFLSMQLSTEEFVKRLPSIDVLVSEYHVPADAAFFLARPFYVNAINTRYEELRRIDKNNKQASSSLKTQRYIEAANEAMTPALDLVRPLYQDKIWDDISPLFYMTFWTLSMYDLYVPTAAYEKQISLLQQQISHIEDNKDMQSKKKKEKERCTNLIEKLKDEEKKQNDHVNRVLGRLKHDQDKWILSGSTKNETVTQLLQLCIFPRCCFTASDALFCAKFIHVLHDLKTPNFSTLICFDRIFCDITYSVTSCTENEAHRYGRFLCASLGTVMKWHSDIDIYEKDCANFPGFVTVFRKKVDHTAKAPVENLDYENYRHVCHKWHFRITKAMVACLESGNYIQIRNALIVLTKILPHYPRITQFGQALERRVDRLSKEEKDKRPDIYAIAMGYAGQLKSKRMTWVPEHSFHIKEEKKGEAKVTNGPVQKAEVKPSGSKEGVMKKLDTDTKGKEGKENKDSKEKKEKSVEKREKTAEKKEKKEAKEKKEKKSGDHAKDGASSKTPREKSNDKEKVNKDKSSSEESKEKSSKDVHLGDGDKPDSTAVKENGKSEGKSKKSDKKSKEEKIGKLKVKREKQDHSEERRAEKGKKSVSKEQEKLEERANAASRERAEERSSSSTVTSSSSLSAQRQSEDALQKYVDDRDPKRRKIDVTPSSGKSPSTEREREREREWDRDRDWDRKERKRDHSLEKADIELKRRRSEEIFSMRSKQNGDSDISSSKRRSHSKEKDWQMLSNKHASPTSRSGRYETSPVMRNRQDSPTRLVRIDSPPFRSNKHSSPPMRSSRHISPPPRLSKHSSPPPPPRSVKHGSPSPRASGSKKDLGSSDESPVRKPKVKKEKLSSSKKSKK